MLGPDVSFVVVSGISSSPRYVSVVPFSDVASSADAFPQVVFLVQLIDLHPLEIAARSSRQWMLSAASNKRGGTSNTRHPLQPVARWAGVQGVELCLKMLSPLRSINETKQNLQFSSQFSLGNVKLWERVLSCERHTVTIEDAHLAPPFHG
jgi:hypothetical protein